MNTDDDFTGDLIGALFAAVFLCVGVGVLATLVVSAIHYWSN